ncbi:alpha/beta fold hydrolase [Serratia rubidaea]|nr:alpha/beta fold hydrolase [Serratia rubidaea]MBD8452404.1 alpha/beta fold hydrolase [Serratia rubidaea]MBS0974224.1 alpha/beta fold hydrolase [Serratia rubidaea]UJD81003.1 lysophospholipase [Serratia rubidaea]UJD85563.1 lysophospholipase [Serratia rubidaea]
MLELKASPSNVRREIRKIRQGTVELAIHTWLPENPKAAVFYFHGLQSHAGWIWEAGRQFANNDVAVFVLDRRGCGISDGERGDIPSVEVIVEDYIVALKWVRNFINKKTPLCLFGHCLGGSFMAAVMHHPEFNVRYDSAIFCSTWLGKLHSSLSEKELAQLYAEDSMELWDAGLHSADFTDYPQYRDFIDTDDLAIRKITKRSRRSLAEVERMYVNAQGELPPVPMAYVSGTTDPIIDLKSAQAAFLKMTDSRGTILTLPTNKHYLFYTPVRRELVDWASSFVLLQAREVYA